MKRYGSARRRETGRCFAGEMHALGGALARRHPDEASGRGRQVGEPVAAILKSFRGEALGLAGANPHRVERRACDTPWWPAQRSTLSRMASLIHALAKRPRRPSPGALLDASRLPGLTVFHRQ